VENVAGQIIERYLRDGDYQAARSVLAFWQTEFRDLAPAAAARWQQRFQAAAARQSTEAARLIREKQYVAARKAVGKARAIWPQLEEAATLTAQIQRDFPFVTVGVLEAAPRHPQWRADCWPALRAGRLTQRLLAELIDFGAEGGVYHSPFGELAVDESGRQATFKLNAPDHAAGVTADALARHLLSFAQPASSFFRPDFASLLSGVALDPPDAVRLRFSRIHVRPEALLQIPLPEGTGAAEFSIADQSPEQIVFSARSAASLEPGRLHAIVEQTLADDEAAVAALVAGDIDVLDRVPPWHLKRLRDAQGIQVESYRLPTVHVLIPNFRRPLIARREFRRALCFGIDRQWIVERVLLGGQSAAGFEVISGPFPAGASLSDPLRYGYNNQLAPRPFEPRLAAILAAVAWANVQSSGRPGQSDSDAPDGRRAGPSQAPPQPAGSADLPVLTLAHAADPVARLACQSIQAQLEREGIKLQLKEFTADELLAGRVDCDLRYAELAVWEPVADARRILGPASLTAELRSPHLDAALRRLDLAGNWNDVRARLAELHEIAHHELPVIPLWQTINHFAYRASVRGIGRLPVTLYQNIESWSTSAGGRVARLAPSE
jgi:hypothetical protein